MTYLNPRFAHLIDDIKRFTSVDLNSTGRMTGMAVDVEGQTPSLASIWGGLSSPAIRPVVLYMVYRGGRAVQIPVIGIGGISSMDQIVRLVKTGPGAHRAQLPHVN